MSRSSALFSFVSAILAIGLMGSVAKAGSPLPVDTSKTFAWCIVPYDEPERTPAERMAMLKRLGISEYIWDWRDRHIALLPAEIEAAKNAGITLRGVWIWIDARTDSVQKLGPKNEAVFRAVEAAGLQLEYWIGFDGNVFAEGSENDKVERGAAYIRMLRDRAAKNRSVVALYNHGGWFGEPRNEIKIIKAVGGNGVGLVYNFHHGHDHVEAFDTLARDMAPFLLAVNVNGMRAGGQKILPIGEGEWEEAMIASLQNAGFHGPWGILGHVEGVDVEPVLRKNLEGLRSLGRD